MTAMIQCKLVRRSINLTVVDHDAMISWGYCIMNAKWVATRLDAGMSPL